jgi:hypothetical protein
MLLVFRGWRTSRYTVLGAAAIATAMAVLSGCGGGELTTPVHAQATHKFALQAPTERPHALATVGAKELFDWAEFKYAALFPKGPQNTDIQYEGFTYTIRGYANGNYLGLRADGRIFGLGPFTGNLLTPFGALADYAALVQTDSCQVYPGSCGGPRAWAGAALLETNNDFNVSFGNQGPLTAIDAQGNALVLWEQSDGTPDGSTRKVYLRRYVAGQGWASATVIPGLQARNAVFVDGRLLADAAGNVTWVDVNIGARRYTPASGWATNVIAAPGAPAASLADAQIDANGTLHVLRRSGGQVWHATLPAGASQWTAWVGLAGTNEAVTGGVKLALLPGSAGSAVAIWRERNPGDSNDSLWANRMLGGTWQSKVRIEEVFTNVNGEPAVAMDASGHAIAAWHQGNSLYVNRLDAASGAWGVAQEVDAGQVSSTFNARVGIAMHADGRAAIGWNSGIFALKTMTYAPSAGFGAPVTAASYSIDRTLRMDGEGRVVLVHRSDPGFQTPNPSGIRLQTQELPWGGTWSATARLDTGPGSLLDNVAFAMNSAGLGVIAWGQNDLASSSVRNSLWSNLRR